MKRIAIVGTSHLNNREADGASELITDIIRSEKDGVIILSGGAAGVDSVAEKIAKEFGIKSDIYKPKENSWEFYKKRNLKIAIECDEIFCISTKVKTEKCYHHKALEDHERTGGCWTLKKALDMGKKCRFFKV